MDVRPAANQGSAGVGSDPHHAFARLLPLLLPVVATGAAALTASLIALAADPPSFDLARGARRAVRGGGARRGEPGADRTAARGTDLARRGVLRRDRCAVRAGGGGRARGRGAPDGRPAAAPPEGPTPLQHRGVCAERRCSRRGGDVHRVGDRRQARARGTRHGGDVLRRQRRPHRGGDRAVGGRAVLRASPRERARDGGAVLDHGVGDAHARGALGARAAAVARAGRAAPRRRALPALRASRARRDAARAHRRADRPREPAPLLRPAPAGARRGRVDAQRRSRSSCSTSTG